MVVAAGRLEYQHFGGVANFHTAVHDDGSFKGSAYNMRNSQLQRLKGDIVGDTIEADTENPYCEYHLTLKKEQAP
jgi:hypothetical protein